MKLTYKDEPVKLIGVFQSSYIVEPSALMGRHNGGVMAYPVAVIEHYNGELSEVRVHELKARYQE